MLWLLVPGARLRVTKVCRRRAICARAGHAVVDEIRSNGTAGSNLSPKLDQEGDHGDQRDFLCSLLHVAYSTATSALHFWNVVSMHEADAYTQGVAGS